jgi:ankyrin repeat protein
MLCMATSARTSVVYGRSFKRKTVIPLKDRPNKEGLTPIGAAALNGHVDIVKYLVKIGAELDKADNEGNTPLYGAAYSGQLGSVRALVEVSLYSTPTTNDTKQTTNNKQQTTNNKQQTTNNNRKNPKSAFLAQPSFGQKPSLSKTMVRPSWLPVLSRSL